MEVIINSCLNFSVSLRLDFVVAANVMKTQVETGELPPNTSIHLHKWCSDYI